MARVRGGVQIQRSPFVRGRGWARFALLGVGLLVLCASGCTNPTFAEPDAQADDEDAQVEESDTHEVGQSEEDSGLGSDDAAPPSVMDAGGGGTSPELDAASRTANDAATQGDVVMADDHDDSIADAGADAGALPSWALPLIGKYAKRSVTFSYDTGGILEPLNTRNVEHSILTISQRGDKLALSIELCAFRVVGTDSSTFYFKNPGGMPKLTGNILLGAPNTFSSERMVHSLGFDPARGASCGASGKRTRYPDQTWSSAMCDCSPSPLPDSLDDCRVIDGDSDSRPGVTGRGNFISASLSDVVMTFQYALTFSDGQIKEDKTHELRELRTQTQSCLNFNADACSFGNNTLCATGGTTKLLPREDATCANFPEADFGALPNLPSPVNDCR